MSMLAELPSDKLVAAIILVAWLVCFFSIVLWLLQPRVLMRRAARWVGARVRRTP